MSEFQRYALDLTVLARESLAIPALMNLRFLADAAATDEIVIELQVTGQAALSGPEMSALLQAGGVDPVVFGLTVNGEPLEAPLPQDSRLSAEELEELHQRFYAAGNSLLFSKRNTLWFFAPAGQMANLDAHIGPFTSALEAMQVAVPPAAPTETSAEA